MMMSKFAKLYESNLGQVLVKIDSNEEGLPEVRFFFQPDLLGVCNFAYSWPSDSDADWDRAEELFNSLDEEKVIETVKSLIKTATNIGE
jgi:uncharacterized protein YrzB (UPF0473 family)